MEERKDTNKEDPFFHLMETNPELAERVLSDVKRLEVLEKKDLRAFSICNLIFTLLFILIQNIFDFPEQPVYAVLIIVFWMCGIKYILTSTKYLPLLLSTFPAIILFAILQSIG